VFTSFSFWSSNCSFMQNMVVFCRIFFCIRPLDIGSIYFVIIHMDPGTNFYILCLAVIFFVFKYDFFKQGCKIPKN
jgi:hypothetical protein